MASSSPQSTCLLVGSSSSSVDASVFNCLSPLKSEKGTYWSRLTVTDTTLRPPRPVFTSPQETVLSRSDEENRSFGPSQPVGSYSTNLCGMDYNVQNVEDNALCEFKHIAEASTDCNSRAMRRHLQFESWHRYPSEIVISTGSHLNNASEPNTNRIGELSQGSPKRRCRKKATISNENDDHKGCNCKKSKCLKLYCECFSAGKFCVESCGCTNCFNKPEYEDTILDTKQQIESRNPLAFAPKVLTHPTDSPMNKADDENGTTPASARHKRGCNCKKSKCHKKYCECYQSGVGCSDGCRCDGCKNPFGAKTVYRRVERWRNQSHEKRNTGQTGAGVKTAPLPRHSSEAVFFQSDGGLDWQYPINVCTQQLYGSSILQDLTNEYATYENIMINDASTPSKVLKASSQPGPSSLRSLRSGGKFILQGMPSFPALSPYSSGENGSND